MTNCCAANSNTAISLEQRIWRTQEHVPIHYRQYYRDKNYTKEISFDISQFRIQFENNEATVQVADKCKRFAIFLADNNGNSKVKYLSQGH